MKRNAAEPRRREETVDRSSGRVVGGEMPEVQGECSGGHPFDEGQQVAHILQTAHIFQLKFQAELLFHGGQQVDLLQAVPILNVIGTGLRSDDQLFIVKVVAEDLLYGVKNTLLVPCVAPILLVVSKGSGPCRPEGERAAAKRRQTRRISMTVHRG